MVDLLVGVEAEARYQGLLDDLACVGNAQGLHSRGGELDPLCEEGDRSQQQEGHDCDDAEQVDVVQLGCTLHAHILPVTTVQLEYVSSIILVCIFSFQQQHCGCHSQHT